MSKKKKKKISKPVVKDELLPGPGPSPAPAPAPKQQPPAKADTPKWRVPLLAAVALAIAALLFFFLRAPRMKVSAGTFRNSNILLITIDTLRADHLPVYGYTGVKTPNISRLADQGLVFKDTIAEIPLTLPSHATILTGLLPMKHGLRDNSYVLSSKIRTIAEILKSNGYSTAAFVSSAVLDSKQHLNKGFDFYFDNFDESGEEQVPGTGVERRAGDTEKETEAWIHSHAQQKMFVWVHFYDPHDPYAPPEPFRTEYASHPYDGEIAYTDEAIGKLFAALQKDGLMEKTVIVLTADHGESLGEHGEPTHGIFLYDSTLKVPLIIKLPQGKHAEIPELVRHIDLAPTILQWVGIDPDPGMQGRSLIALIQGKEKEKRTAYSESKFGELHYGWSPLESLTNSEYKFINAPHAELYARKTDPSELNNLIRQQAATASSLKGNLDDILKMDTGDTSKAGRTVDAETEEKLRALGYVSSTVEATAESRKIDPKDKIYLHRYLSEAFVAMGKKDYPQVLEKLSPLLKEIPNMVEANYLAGVASASMQQYPKAIEYLTRTVQFKPDHTQALYNLAYAYQVTGDYADAEKNYGRIFNYDKDYLPAIVQLAAMYRAGGATDRADAYFHKALSLYLESLSKTKAPAAQSRTFASIAELFFHANDLEHARQNLLAAIELTPHAPNLHYNLAQLYENGKQPEKAVEEYQKEIEVNPSNYMALSNLGLLCRQMNRLDEADRAFRRVLQIIPGDLQTSYFLAETDFAADKNLNEALQLAQQVAAQKPDFQPAHHLVAAIEKRVAAKSRGG